MKKLTFLGTGHGMPIQSSCSAIFLEEGMTNILFDASGGQDILHRFYDVGRKPEEVENIFITHYDSDHILGIVALVRAWYSASEKRKRRLFCSAEVFAAIESLFAYTAKKHWQGVKESLECIIITDRFAYQLDNWKLTFFDIQSSKTPQFGCHIRFADQSRLAFPGDEPIRAHYQDIIQGSDVLIHEAFCLEKDKESFRPHKKQHSTVKEAAEWATKMNSNILALYHMEDQTLDTRKEAYHKEVAQYFDGEIVVPVDGDVFTWS